ncbi:FAD-dependent monooxygenase sorC [Colletotrichum sidae]|uniref:FAD-dependent monooxygenase sorC n=1 Tax=Colletotrichum sidae TaxID=1347389 RepID=A0A4R8PR61_9PEZI|nr:FAD-dependent monooxygenase sorC [Colletotrichum sidae]
MPTRKNFEVAIVGGGISGITLAVALLRRNVPCVIYEKAHAFGAIGAGLGITPNATRAMSACHPDVFAAYEKVASPALRWDFVDGTDPEADDKTLFSLGTDRYSVRGCHRAHFLEELMRLLPEGTTRFNKQLDRVEETPGRLRVVFADGSTAEADAVVGCDGIKSHMRGLVVGREHAAAKSRYTHKFCYRGLVPMDEAVEIIGRERAFGSNIWASSGPSSTPRSVFFVRANGTVQFGERAHLVSYPVAHGAICNVVLHCQGDGDWPSDTQLVLPARREDQLSDARGLTPRLQQLVERMKTVDRWALFDLFEHPVPFFAKGRLCLIGDAAHASTPHMGAGAGMCIEDAAVLAALLGHDGVQDGDDVAVAFATFDANRRERGHFLVRGSRRMGELYEFRTEIGKDFEKMSEEIVQRKNVLWDFDVQRGIEDAVTDLERRLATPREGL